MRELIIGLGALACMSGFLARSQQSRGALGLIGIGCFSYSALHQGTGLQHLLDVVGGACGGFLMNDSDYEDDDG